MSKQREILLALGICVLLTPVAGAVELTATFREGGGSGYTHLQWDGTDINPDTDVVGDYDQDHLRCSLASPDSHFVLLAVKDLPTELPISSSDIISATLTVVGYWGENDVVTTYRVLTDWLPDAAGENEYDVTGQHAELSSVTSWVGGGFSTADYDSANGVSESFTWTFWESLDFDVTDMVKAMYDAGGPYSFALTSPPGRLVSIYNPSYAEEIRRPILEIVYQEIGTYDLTVNSGTGDGSYEAGTVVAIVADPPPSGLGFDEWVGDVTNIDNVNAPSTTITMLGGHAEITAAYAPGYYLRVVCGTGDGIYGDAVPVAISADPPPSNQVFAYWSGDTQYVDDVHAESTSITMPAADATVTAMYKDQYASTYTVYQNIEEVTTRVHRLYYKPTEDLIDANGFFQCETLIFRDLETGKEIWSLTREKGVDIANIERRCAWSANGQYISYISNKDFWDYRTGSMWSGSWAGYTHIANADSTKRRKLWAVGPSGLASFQDKFNNWDVAVPNRIYYAMDNRIWRITLGPGNNDTDNVAEAVWTFSTSASRTIQEVHDDNWLLVEESGASPNCYLFNLAKDPSDPYFCLSYPLAGEVHPGSFRFKRSLWGCSGGYEYISGGIALMFDETSVWEVSGFGIHIETGVSMGHLWYGTPDDRRGYFGTYNGKFGLWLQHPGYVPVLMADVPDGHVTWCSMDPEWFFGAVGPGTCPDYQYNRRLLACNEDGSTVRIICTPWDRRRIGEPGYAGIPRPNQSPDATKCWFHSSMLNAYDSDTGSFIAVFRKPYAPTDLQYSGGQLTFTPHTISREVKSYFIYRNDGDRWQFEQEVPSDQTSCSPGGEGTYMVTALEWSGLESDTSSPTVTVPGGSTGSAVTGWDTTPPAKPTNLAVVAEGNNRYRVSWDSPADQDLRYFNIYFSAAEDPPITQKRRIVSPPKGTTEYLDWSTQEYGDAYYAVTAVDRQGNESAPIYLDQTYTLTVTNGSGSGEYDEDEVVAISADAAPSGKAFAVWVGDTAYVADRFQADTTVTMPADDVSVTATYAFVYTLTVNSGSGDGQYLAGTVVGIDAAPAPSGKEFDQWTGDVGGIAEVESESTTMTIPADDVEITATYADILYTLTVNSGTGDGDYAEAEVVPIVADPAPGCESFMEWVGDTDYVADTAAAGTAVTMPASAVEVTATYGFYKGDVNQDGFCGGTDLDYILGDWGHSGTEIINPIADINGDGFVGGTDLDYVLGDWGKGACPP